MAGAYYQQFRVKGRTQSWTGSLSIARYTRAYTHTQRLEQCTHASSPHVYIFKLWEETLGPGENPETWYDRETPHRQWHRPGIDFFLINILMKLYY